MAALVWLSHGCERTVERHQFVMHTKCRELGPVTRGAVFWLRPVRHLPIEPVCVYVSAASFLTSRAKGAGRCVFVHQPGTIVCFIYWSRWLKTPGVFAQQCRLNSCGAGLLECDCISVCINPSFVSTLKVPLQPAGLNRGLFENP